MGKSRKKSKKKTKRTWKQAFEIKNKTPAKKKKFKNKKEKKQIKIIKKHLPENIITYDLEKTYDDINLDNNQNILFKVQNINIELYEGNFFNIIKIGGDGNCFFRTISKYIYGTENNYAILREAAYNYIVENLTKFYEYCYIENGIYYIDIEEGGIVQKYILDDYIEEIKKDHVYAGYIEINAISIIINRPIILVETLKYKTKTYFKKLAYFNHNQWNSLNIDEIKFINYGNDIHYQLLIPNKKFIIDRINKINLEYDKILYYDKVEKKIFDSSQELKIILVNNESKSDEINTNEEKNEVLNSKKKYVLKKKVMMIHKYKKKNL